MAVKTITITDVAYMRLARLKRPGESFTDLVIRMTEDRRSVMHLAGSWRDLTEAEHDAMAQALQEEEALSEAKMQRRSGRRQRRAP